MPAISVLIDTYNHERFIEQAIVSVLEQDFPPSEREILVVDDGSTDRTPAIVEKFVPQVRYLRKPNGGQASTFNFGIPQTSGQIVAFLDGDDWWAPAKLRRVAEQLESHPDVGAVGHGFYEVYCDGRPPAATLPGEDSLLHLEDAETARRFTLFRCFLGTSRFTVRRSVLDRVLPIPEELVIEADEYMFTLAVAIGRARVLNQPLFHYRLHPDNLFQIQTYSDERCRRRQRVLAALARILPPKLAAAGIRKDVIEVVREPIEVDAERLRLELEGGMPWRTFAVECAAYRLAYDGVDPGYRLFQGLVLGLTLMLPPRVFYRLRRWYAETEMSRFRKILGEPTPVASVIERKGDVVSRDLVS